MVPFQWYFILIIVRLVFINFVIDILIYCEKKQNPEGGKLFDYKMCVNISDIDEVHEKVVVEDKKKKKGYDILYLFSSTLILFYCY